MKKIDWNKVLKTIGIIAVIGVVIWYFEDRSSKQTRKTEEKISNLYTVSDDLRYIASLCEDNDIDNNEAMYDSLAEIGDKCEKMQKLVDDAINYFEPKDPDYGDDRRGWFN